MYLLVIMSFIYKSTLSFQTLTQLIPWSSLESSDFKGNGQGDKSMLLGGHLRLSGTALSCKNTKKKTLNPMSIKLTVSFCLYIPQVAS